MRYVRHARMQRRGPLFGSVRASGSPQCTGAPTSTRDSLRLTLPSTGRRGGATPTPALWLGRQSGNGNQPSDKRTKILLGLLDQPPVPMVVSLRDAKTPVESAQVRKHLGIRIGPRDSDDVVASEESRSGLILRIGLPPAPTIRYRIRLSACRMAPLVVPPPGPLAPVSVLATAS